MSETKRKILYVITKSNWGGAQRYVFDLATNLPKDRFDVLVAAGGNGLLIQKLKEASIRFVPILSFERDISPLNDVRSFCELYRIFKKENPDIIHLNSSKAGGLGAVAAFLYKTLNPKPYTLNPRIIFTVHGWGFRESRPKWQNAIAYFFSWLAAKFQHHLIHVAKRDLDTTINLQIAKKKKTVYIPLGTPQNHRTHPRDDARTFFLEKLGLERNKKENIWVGTVAELTKNKGLSHLIEAVNKIIQQSPNHNLQTIIIGDGEERENLQKQIDALGQKSAIYLSGFIPDAWQYLKAFDIFVMPSLKEGLPYTLLEAANAGIPIIATTVGGIPDLLEHKKNGLLVPPANPTALAHAIITLLENTKKREEFGARGKKRVESEFLFSEMMAKTTKLYQKTR